MGLTTYSERSEDIMRDILSGLENWCTEFNKFFLILFVFLKYILVFILLTIGVLTLLKLRGIYLQQRTKDIEKEKDLLKKPCLLLGWVYIFLGIGILFNFLIYFLIWALDPLPDRLVFYFLKFNGDFDPYNINRIKDVEGLKYPHERTIYYCFAFISFLAILHLVLGIYFLIRNNRLIQNTNLALKQIVFAVIECITFGFTTCLPFFL